MGGERDSGPAPHPFEYRYSGAGPALLSPAVRRVNRAALFALHCFGLLIGTTVEYVGWVGPAIG